MHQGSRAEIAGSSTVPVGSKAKKDAEFLTAKTIRRNAKVMKSID
jgi:hypothetical protein